MTNAQEDRDRMGKTTISFLDANPLVWNLIAKIVAIVNAVRANLTNIDAYRMIQETDSRGATKQQEILRSAAADDATAVASVLKTYYLDQSDETNFKEINFTLSSFNTGTKGQILTKMKRVHTHAVGIPILTLNDYGLQAVDITNLNTKVLAYELAQGVKKSMRDAAGDAGKQIKSNLTDMSKNLKKLDYVLFPIGLTNSSFINQYRLAREVINSGKGHRTAVLEVTGATAITSFGDHLEAGYAIVVTNDSEDFILAGLTDEENKAPLTDEIKIERKSKLIINIPKDVTLFITKFFSVFNPNKNIVAKVTLVLSKGPSKAKAGEVELSGSIK